MNRSSFRAPRVAPDFLPHDYFLRFRQLRLRGLIGVVLVEQSRYYLCALDVINDHWKRAQPITLLGFMELIERLERELVEIDDVPSRIPPCSAFAESIASEGLTYA